VIRTAILSSIALLASSAAAPAQQLTEREFQSLHAELQQPEDAAWRSVPWKVSLVEAQAEAAEQLKPLFIWAMDGHPLGCT